MEPVKRPINGGAAVGKWEVDYGYDTQGKRLRKVVADEDAADKAIDEWKKDQAKYGEFWARLTPVERQSTVAVLTEIRAAKMTLPQVWADHQRWRKDNANTCTTPKAYEDVVTRWKERKLGAHKDQRYVDESAALLMRFGAGREHQNVHEITYQELAEWVGQQKTWKSANTKIINLSIFSSLWEAAIAEGWTSKNIVDRFEEIKKPEPDKRIYPNPTIIHLLAACMHNPATQKVLGELVLGLFGCMRPEEIQSIKAIRNGLSGKSLFGWHDIDLKHRRIAVRKEVAKLCDVRTIRLQPTAWEWLTLAKKLGCEFPTENERKLVDQCCELIGLEEWLRDGLRKNCATHLRTIYKNDYEVTLDMGNSVRILLKNYAALQVPPEQSAEFWEITPELVEKYMKTDAWKKFLIKVARERAEQSASEIAKSAS